MRLIGRVLLDADHIIAPWVSQRVPIWNGWLPQHYRTAGIVSGDQIIGGVVFYEFTGWNCQLAAALDHPRAALPETFRNLARFAFHDLRLLRATALVSKKNRAIRRFLKGVGFVEEGTHRLAFDGKDAAISYGLLASECRWFREP